MRQLAKLLFLLALAGCSTSGGLFQQEEPKPVPLANSPMPPTVPQQASPNRSNLSPAASAAAPAEANEAPGELMDCVTESLQNQLFAESRREIQTEVVCALQGTNLRSISDARTSMHSYHDEKSPRQCPGLSISSTRV